MKKRLIIFITVFTLFFTGISKIYANELGEIKEVKLINHAKETDDVVDIQFIENIPYVKLDSIYNIMASGNKIMINNKETGIYELTTIKGKAILNTIEDTLYSENYGDFIELPEEEQEVPAVIKNMNTIIIGDSKTKKIEFKKYQIDIIGDEGKVWLPLKTAFDLFLFPGFYDGENINIYDHTSATNLITDFDEYKKILSNFFIDDKRTTSNIQSSYNELCLMFDYYYGYPEQSILSESIKEHGFDYTLEHFDNDTKQIKKWLLSDNIDDYYLGVTALDAYLFDGGHTSLSIILPMYIGFFKTLDLEEKIENINQYDKISKISSMEQSDKMNITKKRGEVLIDNYIEKGDTALYAFDSFDYDHQAWNDYYLKKGEYPDDTLGGILKALDKASQNPNIKYFVFDISENGGGLGGLAPVIMDFLGYENHLQYKNTLNNLIEKNIIDTDINFDGIYNEADKVSKYNFNYGVLTSKLTFSTANIFASMAKENNFMILGEQSGGGACSLSVLFTPESLLYSISSNKHIVNNSGNSIDKGIVVDKNLVEKNEVTGIEMNDYSKYYDLTNLSALLNEFYKIEEPKIEEPQTEELNPTESPVSPKTSDRINLFIMLLTLSSLGLVSNIFIKKKIA